MAKRYRRAIFSRTPIKVEKPKIVDRVPVKRHSIYQRIPITFKKTEYIGCPLLDSSYLDCASENYYCEWDASTEEHDYQTFRLIRIQEELSEDETNELIKKITFIKSLGCYVRLITDVPVADEVLFLLGYDPLNVVQFNINIVESSDKYIKTMKHSIFTADNCGLYVGLMLYPIIPGVTKCHDILEFLNSFRCSCNNICFRYLDIPESIEDMDSDYFNINGNMVPRCYYTKLGQKWVVNSYYRRTFSTIMTRFLTGRKVNCSCCNDHICY